MVEATRCASPVPPTFYDADIQKQSIARPSHLPPNHLLAKVQPPRTSLEYPLEKDPTSAIRDVLEGMRIGDVLEVDEVNLSLDKSVSVRVEFVIRARENTWSRAARRKLKLVQTAQATGRPTRNPADVESTLKRKRSDTGSGHDNIPPKKGRLDDKPPTSLQSPEYKMTCSVTVAMRHPEGEASPKRWVQGIQWLYGRDEHREMFEGFASHVERKVSERVR